MPLNNPNPPINIGDAVAKIVKKYQLGPAEFFNNPEMNKLLGKAKTPDEKTKIIKELPFNKILNIVEEIAQNKIELKNLAKITKKELDLSAEISKKLAKDIENEILNAPEKKIDEKKIKEEPQHKTFGSDSYREPIG